MDDKDFDPAEFDKLFSLSELYLVESAITSEARLTNPKPRLVKSAITSEARPTDPEINGLRLLRYVS